MSLYSDSFDRKMLTRAIGAWYRRAISEGSTDQPVLEKSTLKKFKGHDYVLLRNNSDRILAVYRITNQGIIKFLRRWPEGMTEK